MGLGKVGFLTLELLSLATLTCSYEVWCLSAVHYDPVTSALTVNSVIWNTPPPRICLSEATVLLRNAIIKHITIPFQALLPCVKAIFHISNLKCPDLATNKKTAFQVYRFCEIILRVIINLWWIKKG